MWLLTAEALENNMYKYIYLQVHSCIGNYHVPQQKELNCKVHSNLLNDPGKVVKTCDLYRPWSRTFGEKSMTLRNTMTSSLTSLQIQKLSQHIIMQMVRVRWMMLLWIWVKVGAIQHGTKQLWRTSWHKSRLEAKTAKMILSGTFHQCLMNSSLHCCGVSLSKASQLITSFYLFGSHHRIDMKPLQKLRQEWGMVQIGNMTIREADLHKNM